MDLHVLNGIEMFRFAKRTSFIQSGRLIPFNEAMCYGKVNSEPFSQQFIETRAAVHHVTQDQYAEITLQPLQPLFRGDFERLTLWFDADMFCQINLLTLLAWLDLSDFKNDVTVHIVGDRYEPLANFQLNASGYYPIYEEVLIHKRLPEKVCPVLLQDGVQRYLSYLAPDSDLMEYIKRHEKVPIDELVPELINRFREYGLGDSQYEEIIRSQRGSLS